MIKGYRLADGKIVEDATEQATILVVTAPDETERRMLIDQHRIDEHTLLSSLDPDELSRLEFEPDHIAIIYKRPKNYSAEDRLIFKTVSRGLFRFKDRLIVVISEPIDPFAGKSFSKVASLNDLVLKLLYSSSGHFLGHLKSITSITDELEVKIGTSLDNKYLKHFFSLGKSLVYYLNAINSNGALIERMRHNAAKIGFSPEELELLDDLAIENSQCYKQAEIHSNILSALMDARASIVANNLNTLMKTLNLVTIGIMVPTLVVSVFSMNVAMPFNHDHPVTFWLIIGLATVSVAGVIYWWRNRRWQL